MLNPFGVGVALGTDRDPGKGLPNCVLIFCARGIRLGADLHRVRYLAASRFLLACASAKWRSTALAALALRLAPKASRLARIQAPSVTVTTPFVAAGRWLGVRRPCTWR